MKICKVKTKDDQPRDAYVNYYTKKATNSKCAACTRVAKVGQMIMKLDSNNFVHVDCVRDALMISDDYHDSKQSLIDMLKETTDVVS